MSKEEKDLLLKELCARLSYGVKITCFQNDALTPYLIDFRDNTIHTTSDFNGTYIKVQLEDCKLYLRPLSDMTEREKEEYDALYTYVNDCIQRKFKIDFSIATDWFNKHHFDYRGLVESLIEKGLAIEAPEGMYNIKDK